MGRLPPENEAARDTDRLTLGRIPSPLDFWTGRFPASGFGQNGDSSVERLASQIYPRQLTKKRTSRRFIGWVTLPRKIPTYIQRITLLT